MSTISFPAAPPWSLALALLLLASALLPGPTEGAVRAGGRGSSYSSRSAKASTGDHQRRAGGKSYACPQDLAQQLDPSGRPPVEFFRGEGPNGEDGARPATLLMEDRPVALIDEPDIDADDDIDTGSGTNVSSRLNSTEASSSRR
ncbi:hypothetical protein ZHAS_00018049 [Anopheles sinensis]|uniref:Uncharacterized protein n=1 Tax=Anopheles sinensis TaxID=74873 RepID=A0A084WIG3_ANOSI|nr:hypothetical protein ZHAS_00018049 [Anopheles sinensis]